VYKYKLKEEPFSPGDINISKGVKSTVKDVNPETGTILGILNMFLLLIVYLKNLMI
jgi:hypothetical protein